MLVQLFFSITQSPSSKQFIIIRQDLSKWGWHQQLCLLWVEFHWLWTDLTWYPFLSFFLSPRYWSQMMIKDDNGLTWDETWSSSWNVSCHHQHRNIQTKTRHFPTFWSILVPDCLGFSIMFYLIVKRHERQVRTRKEYQYHQSRKTLATCFNSW